jgi:hypothetical protein
MTDAAKLLAALFYDTDAVQIRVIHEQEKRVFLNRVFHSPDEAAAYLEKNAAGIERKNAFACVGVNPREMSGDGEVEKFVNIVVDIDGAPLPDWAHEHADVMCTRDETHHHVYFCFSPMGATEQNRKKYSDTVKKLLNITGSAEKLAHDPERVIRLPGFTHGKTGKPAPGYRVVFVRDEIRREAFNKKFAWLKETRQSEQALPAASVPTPAPTVKASENTIAYLHALYAKKPTRAAGDGRSRELFFIGLDCHAWGVDEADAVKLATRISEEKHEPAESLKVIEHQVKSAYKYRRGDFGSLLNEAASKTERQQVAARLKFERIGRARDLLARFIYVHGAERLINRDTRFELTTAQQINNYILSQLGEPVTLADLLQNSAIETADALDFAPGEPELFERSGQAVFNKYVAGDEPGTEGKAKDAVKVFREHVAYLSTSEAEEKTLLEFFAFIAQRPGEKLTWAPLIISKNTGIGKSALSELSAQLLGAHNVGYAESDDLTGQHTDYIAEKLLVVAHEVETGDKNVMRRLKSLITEPRVRVIAKYARTYETRNCANFLFFSNRLDAIRVDDNDRRLFVVYNRKEPKEQAYYDRLFETFKESAGHIMAYLLTVDLSGFNPHARPAHTEGRKILTEHSESELSTFLRESFEQHTGPFARAVFTSREVLDFVSRAAPESARRYATQRAVAAWLQERNFYSHDYFENVDNVRRHFRAWSRLERKADFERARLAQKSEKKESFI